jgi:hypothetical protein
VGTHETAAGGTNLLSRYCSLITKVEESAA